MPSPSRGPRRGPTQPQKKPQNPAVNRAIELLQAGNVEASAAIIDPMLKKGRKDASVIRAKGLIEMKRGRYTEAEGYLNRARDLDPGHPMISVDQAMIHQLRGRYDKMVEAARNAYRVSPGRSQTHMLLADALIVANRSDEAYDFIRELGKGKTLEPMLADPLTKVLDLQGRYEEALDVFAQVGDAKGLLPIMRKRMNLRRGRILEKLGDHDGAMEAFETGYAQLNLSFDPDAFDRRVDDILAALREANFAEPETDAASTLLPVMIVSMPRSGTSLLERIMAAHPLVNGIGEESVISETIREYRDRLGKETIRDMPSTDPVILEGLRTACLARIRQLSGDSERTVSKHLQNWSYLPVIAAWYPKAHVVRITRDPAATGISIYSQDLPAQRMPWVARLDWIGRMIASERRFVAAARELVPNPWFEVVYEDLIDDPESKIPPIIESIGMEFDPVCLSPHKAESTGKGGDGGKQFRPTLSLHQVRKPISKDSVDRAAVWGDRLADLQRGLEEGGCS